MGFQPTIVYKLAEKMTEHSLQIEDKVAIYSVWTLFLQS